MRNDTELEAGRSAIIDELALCGWNELPAAEGRAAALEALRQLGGPAESGLAAPADYYGLLNRVRERGWARGAGDETWRRYVASRRRSFAGVRSGALAVRISVRRHFHAAGAVSTGSVRLRAPYPIAHPSERIRRCTAIVPSEAERSVEQEGRLEVTVPMESVRSGAAEAPLVAGFTAEVDTDLQGACDDPRTEAELRRTYLDWPLPFTSNGPLIHSAAARVRSVGDPERRVELAARELLSAMRIGHVYYDALPHGGPFELLDGRSYIDCYLASCAYASLLRLIEIPSRILSGILLEPDAPMTHYWVEARVPGRWVPVDFYCWDLGDGPAHELPWAECTLGRLDPRIRLEELPSRPTGSFGFRLSDPWLVRRRRIGERGVGVGIYRRVPAGSGDWMPAADPMVEDVITVDPLASR